MKYQNGFTLIEIIVSTSILAIVVLIGAIISMDFFKGYSFRAQGSVTVSVLQKARSQSMNNIDQARHGVHLADPLQYIIFECKSALPQCNQYSDRDPSQDIVINPAYGSNIGGLPLDVVFEQLSGNCITSNCATTPLAISATDSGKTQTITINSEGQISW